jgi:hypothetical protein
MGLTVNDILHVPIPDSAFPQVTRKERFLELVTLDRSIEGSREGSIDGCVTASYIDREGEDDRTPQAADPTTCTLRPVAAQIGEPRADPRRLTLLDRRMKARAEQGEPEPESDRIEGVVVACREGGAQIGAEIRACAVPKKVKEVDDPGSAPPTPRPVHSLWDPHTHQETAGEFRQRAASPLGIPSPCIRYASPMHGPCIGEHN